MCVNYFYNYGDEILLIIFLFVFSSSSSTPPPCKILNEIDNTGGVFYGSVIFFFCVCIILCVLKLIQITC